MKMKKIEDVLSYDTLDEIELLDVDDIKIVIDHLKSINITKKNNKIQDYKKQIIELQNLIDKLENNSEYPEDD